MSAVTKVGPVVVVCAVEEEAQHVRQWIADSETGGKKLAGLFPITRGTCNGLEVCLVISDIGHANAAAATTAACILLEPCAVISCGCAGAHTVNLLPGDVVIATETKPMAQCKMLKDGTIRPGGFRSTIQANKVESMHSDPDLIEICRGIVGRGLSLPAWEGVSGTGKRKREGGEEGEGGKFPHVEFGCVGSSDTWTCGEQQLKRLFQIFGSQCEEMEAAAVAQVCARFKIPFLAVKDISNNELLAHTSSGVAQNGSSLDLSQIGRNAAVVTQQVVEKLAQIKLQIKTNGR